MSIRDRLLPAVLLVSLGALSACTGAPDLASERNPTVIQFASVDPGQPLLPAGPELRIHGVVYRTFTVH